MKERFKKEHPLLLIVATILLFGVAIGYNELRLRNILAEKIIFPENIPELVEHNQSQGTLSLETVELNENQEMALGTTDEKSIADVRLKILNGTEIPGLAVAAREFFTEAGFSSVTIGDAPKSNYNTTLIEFRPAVDRWARFAHFLIGGSLEVKMNEQEDLDFDIVITLSAYSVLFEPYLSP